MSNLSDSQLPSTVRVRTLRHFWDNSPGEVVTLDDSPLPPLPPPSPILGDAEWLGPTKFRSRNFLFELPGKGQLLLWRMPSRRAVHDDLTEAERIEVGEAIDDAAFQRSDAHAELTALFAGGGQ